MKIKSFIIACSLFAISVGTYAQKSELNSAKSNYDKFSGLKNPNTMALAIPSLTAAKESIDKAVAHEKTKNEPSAWAYRALIYADLAMLDSVPAKTEPLITEAANSIKKATELDKEGANKSQIETATRLLAQNTLNKGVREFQAQNFADAYKSFSTGLTYLPNDTTLTYYAGLSAINNKEYDKAIEKYNSLTKTNFSAANQVYMDLSRLYAMKGDTAAAIRVASEGSKKFANDTQLATQEIELSLISGKQKEVIDKITAQSQKDPNNKTLPFYLGIAYNSLKDYPKAEEAYKKAIAIDPNFADANINLGGLIMNNGIDLYNKANKLPTSKQKDYDAMMKKAQAEFDRAFPYLEKSVELDPKSRMGWENLKTYYVVKKNNAKVAEITKKLSAL
jgi:tetratricopeptide (TPR) repeat protein